MYKYIKDAIAILDSYKRNYYHKNHLCINIKMTNFIDVDDLKKELNKIYSIELLNEINFEKDFEYFLELETEAFFEYAKDLIKGFNIYQYGRCGGWLGIEGAYDDYINILENYDEYEKDEIKNYIKEIKEIDKSLKTLKEYHKRFFDNIQEYFIDYIKSYVIEDVEETIKEKADKYTKLLTLI